VRLELINLLRCPKTGGKLILKAAESLGEEIIAGILSTDDGNYRYHIKGGIPRFVNEDNYADNFGIQWNFFRQTQLDSYSGIPISSERFWRSTNWNASDLKNKWVLDVGCGAGRFAEIALQSGAHVVALDYSSAVNACYENLSHYQNLHVIQGDIYHLPLSPGTFSYVYSLGVLQHTPNVEKAFQALPPMLLEGGRLCVDYYWRRFRSLVHVKYLLRPVTTRVSQNTLFKIVQATTPYLLILSRLLGAIPVFGRFFQRLIPVADYKGIFPLSNNQLEEWAILDTFDNLAPKYDKPQTSKTVKNWMKMAGLVEIEVGHWGHLVVRGKKPAKAIN